MQNDQEMQPEVVVEEKKKTQKQWVNMIRRIHHMILVDDGTEEPPERTEVKDVFETKDCKQCGMPIKYPDIFYCSECKEDRKFNKIKRRFKHAE